MDKSNTCHTCSCWEPKEGGPSSWLSGTCHYWPPTRSKQLSITTTEQIENPIISELKVRLQTAESLQLQLETESTSAFAAYPVKTSYEELQKARADVQEGLSNIAYLKGQIIKEEAENPLVLRKISHVHESGDWPVTASDDWCGQWLQHLAR